MGAGVSRPRILYVTYVPPWEPKYGGALRCHGVIAGLAQRSDLHVALASDAPDNIEAFRAGPVTAGVTTHVLTPDEGWGGIDDWAASRTVRAAFGKAKYRSSFDALVELVRPDVVWYFEVEALRRTGLPHGLPTVLDLCDVRWRKLMRLAGLNSGTRRFWGWMKAAVLAVHDTVLSLRVSRSLVASPEEVRLLWPNRAVSVLPNGFDFPAALPESRRDGARLVFFGSLFYTPNAEGVRWLCEQVWPLIRERWPDARLDVVGLPSEQLEDLAIPDGVTFLGYVDDIDTVVRHATALVVPLHIAGGTRIKIVEAWAKGLPVVSTTIGAEGLGVVPGTTALIGDTAEAFAAQCISLLSDADLRERLARQGFAHGRERFDWAVIHRGLDEVIGNALNPE